MTRMKAVRTWAISFLNLALLWSAATVGPIFAQESSHAEHEVPAKLVRDVRRATRQFLDVNNAGPAGYGPALGASVVPTTEPWAFTTSTARSLVTAKSSWKILRL